MLNTQKQHAPYLLTLQQSYVELSDGTVETVASQTKFLLQFGKASLVPRLYERVHHVRTDQDKPELELSGWFGLNALRVLRISLIGTACGVLISEYDGSDTLFALSSDF